jgi:hypothetical protein
MAMPLALGTLGDLHLAINGRFTLNPSQGPAFHDFTPLAWVRARKLRENSWQLRAVFPSVDCWPSREGVCWSAVAESPESFLQAKSA